jgi:hypothetical protein
MYTIRSALLKPEEKQKKKLKSIVCNIAIAGSRCAKYWQTSELLLRLGVQNICKF